MNYVKIACFGAILTVPEFLAPIWPYDLRPEEWPTFCGGGEGIGDKIVPDTIHGVSISPAGLVHDIDFAVLPKTFPSFMAANGRFFLNSAALIMASDLTTWKMIRALNTAMVAYLVAVSTVGVLFFTWFTDRAESTDPLNHPVVKSRLKKIAEAQGKIDRGEHIEYPASEWEGTEI